MPAREPLRVLLLLSSLHGGGAERVAVQLLHRLDPSRFDVRMGLLRASGPYLDDVPRDRLLVADHSDRFNFDGSNRAQFTPAKLVRGAIAAPAAFRQMIRQARPDVVVSFLKGTNLIVWRALAGMRERPKWIAREGNNALAVIREEAPFPLAARLVTALTAAAYRRADAVLAVSRKLGDDLARDFRLDPARVAAIPNFVDCTAARAAAAAPLQGRPRRPFVLAVGRLEHQKGFDILLRAFASSGAAADHDLVILGRGSLEASLRALAADLGIASNVHWPGFADNPFAWLKQATLFVLPSRWEGFSSALLEAMAVGSPVLATDCDYGSGEAITHGRNGWLVPPDDPKALGEAIATLLRDPDLRGAFARGASETVRGFDIAPIVARYSVLIERVARG